MFSPSDRMLISAVIFASASSSSWVRGRSRWAPRRLRGASWRSCKRRFVFRVCSLVDCRTDFRAIQELRNAVLKTKQKNSWIKLFKHVCNFPTILWSIHWMHTTGRFMHPSFQIKGKHYGSISRRFREILLSAKSWNSCGILLFGSTLVFSVFFCSSVLLGLGFGTFIGSLD